MDALISPLDAERVVAGLKTHTLCQVGSESWMEQRGILEKINMQAHQSAASNTDEYLVAAFASLEQVSVLVHELVVAEVWVDHVLPALLEAGPSAPAATESESAASYATVKPYLVVFHSATLANLLELVLYSKAATLSMTDEALLELTDWALRRLAWLNSVDRSTVSPAALDPEPETLIERSAWDNLAAQAVKVNFDVSVIALSLLRYLSQVVDDAPVELGSRLMRVHDSPLALVPLIHSPPYVTSAPVDGKMRIHKYMDGAWAPMANADAAILSKTEIQVWLTLYNLLMDPALRPLYAFNSSKAASLTSLTGALTQPVLDQIPVLTELARFLHEISLSSPPAPTATPSPLILETVAVIRAHTLAELEEAGPVALANAFLEDLAAESQSKVSSYIQDMAQTYSLDNLEDMLDPPRCAQCGDDAVHRCSRCKTEWYCGRECQVAAWAAHKPLCDIITSSTS